MNKSTSETMTTMIEQLQHPDKTIRSCAILSLGESADVTALPILLDCIGTEPDLFVREHIMWSLVRMGEAAVLHVANPAIRHHAAHTLSKIGDRRAVDALITALIDADAVVAAKVAFALGQLGDVRAIPALLQHLDHLVERCSQR